MQIAKQPINYDENIAKYIFFFMNIMTAQNYKLPTLENKNVYVTEFIKTAFTARI